MKILEHKSLLLYLFIVMVCIVILVLTGIAEIIPFSVPLVFGIITAIFAYFNGKRSQKKEIKIDEKEITVPKLLPPLEVEKETNQNISIFLQKEREYIFNTIAPGSTSLLIGEIIGGENLFISPPWANYMDVVQSEELIEYLVSNLSSGNSILLLGDPGQGKTTILKRVFAIMVDSFVEKSNDVMPVYIPLRDIAYSGNKSGRTLSQLWQLLHTKARNPLPLTYDQFT